MLVPRQVAMACSRAAPALLHRARARTTRMSSGYSCGMRLLSTKAEDFQISRTRTGTTERLWKMRMLKSASASPPRTDGSRSPRDSLLEIDLDFRNDKALAAQYENYRGGVRLGKILEDLDACAGNVSRLHADPDGSNSALVIVTANVDQIHVLDRFRLDKSYLMRGQVTWVGTSSMEISVRIADKEFPDHVLLSAAFLMVARGADGTSARVPPLHCETEDEKRLFQKGLARKEFRKHEALTSLEVAPPTPIEVEHLHKFFMRKGGDGVELKPGRHLATLASTLRQSVVLCEPQERNTSNRIFGGFLMQKAYELAYATTIRVTGSKAPVFLGVDDISFIHPVEIASIITFTSKVVCSSEVPEGISYSVRVTTDVFDIKTSTERRCNIFHFGFGCTDDSATSLPVCAMCPNYTSQRSHQPWLKRRHRDFLVHIDNYSMVIKPELYTEALQYLDGKRRLSNMSREAYSHGSALCDMGLCVMPTPLTHRHDSR